jgi:hypothetical protein
LQFELEFEFWRKEKDRRVRGRYRRGEELCEAAEGGGKVVLSILVSAYRRRFRLPLSSFVVVLDLSRSFLGSDQHQQLPSRAISVDLVCIVFELRVAFSQSLKKKLKYGKIRFDNLDELI